MATTTTYSCDRCKEQFDDRKNLQVVSAGVGQYWGSDGWSVRFSQDWCFPCIESFGIALHSRERHTVKPEDHKVTLEDIIREMVREEIQQQ